MRRIKVLYSYPKYKTDGRAQPKPVTLKPVEEFKEEPKIEPTEVKAEKPKFICDVCGQICGNKGMLTMHKKSKHS
jgi:hypothetical protein